MESESELNVGDAFDDFGRLKWAIELFERTQKSNYWIRDCRTIEAAQKKGIKRPMKESLVYYNLTWACVKGGRSYDESTRSPRGDCGSYVKVAVSKDGQALVIKDICTNHNHDTSQETFELLPKQKRLSKSGFIKSKKIKIKKEEEILESPNPAKKTIHKSLIKKSAKIVKMKKMNSCNIEANSPIKFRTRPKSLQDFVENLRENCDVTIEVIEDEKGCMKGIFWQDSVMKTRFDSFPELLMVGCANDMNKLKTSVIFQVIVDGNGESEIASLFLVSSEDPDTFTSLINIFRNHNPAWLRTRTILTSKDVKHRSVFRSCYPDASLHICQLQVLEEMKRELAIDKMNISSLEKIGVLSLLEKMASAQCSDIYDDLYDELQSTGLSKVMNYFNKKWHPIREEWVSGLKTSVHFDNETTKRMDIIYDRIRDMVKKSSPLPHFCQDLQRIIYALREETDTHISHDIINSSRAGYSINSVEYRFSNFLTPYAFSKVVRQIHLSTDIKLDAEICDVTSPISVSTVDHVMVSATSCSCQFFITSWLPCRHIFAFRQKAGVELFFEDIAPRWHLATLKSILPPSKLSLRMNSARADKSLRSLTFVNQNDAINSHFQYSKPQASWPSYAQGVLINGQHSDMSQDQKFESLLAYGQRLAQLGSDVPMGKFVKRREVLSRLVESWERGEDFEDDSSTSNTFLSSNGHLTDINTQSVATSVSTQSFQGHGPNPMNENHMGLFVTKERSFQVAYHQQQEHGNINMGMMDHIPPWSHIVL